MPHNMEPGARVSDGRSPGGCVTVDLREPPATTEDPMTDDRMPLVDAAMLVAELGELSRFAPAPADGLSRSGAVGATASTALPGRPRNKRLKESHEFACLLLV